jgi:hypothetical protein
MMRSRSISRAQAALGSVGDGIVAPTARTEPAPQVSTRDRETRTLKLTVSFRHSYSSHSRDLLHSHFLCCVRRNFRRPLLRPSPHPPSPRPPSLRMPSGRPSLPSPHRPSPRPPSPRQPAPRRPSSRPSPRPPLLHPPSPHAPSGRPSPHRPSPHRLSHRPSLRRASPRQPVPHRPSSRPSVCEPSAHPPSVRAPSPRPPSPHQPAPRPSSRPHPCYATPPRHTRSYVSYRPARLDRWRVRSRPEWRPCPCSTASAAGAGGST